MVSYNHANSDSEKYHYIIINFDTLLYIKFNAYRRTSCINITIFNAPVPTNIVFTDLYKEVGSSMIHDGETASWQRTFARKDFIQSVVINMCACNFVRTPVWDLYIEFDDQNWIRVNRTHRYILPVAALHVQLNIYKREHSKFWTMVHMWKPEDVPDHAIWEVQILVTRMMLHVAIEVLGDHSSSWYTWDDLRSPNNLYLTINKAVNILIMSNTAVTHANCNPWWNRCFLDIWFIRHFIYDETLITGKTPQQSHLTFHNKR